MSLTFLQSEPGEEPVVVEGDFTAPPERLYRAWTDPQELKGWFGAGLGGPDEVALDVRTGGAWKVVYENAGGRRDTLFGEYLTVEPARHLAFSWQHERRHPDGKVETTAKSQVSLRFDAVEGGTRLRLVHEAIVRSEGRLGVGEGWNDAFAKLQALCVETGRTATE